MNRTLNYINTEYNKSKEDRIEKVLDIKILRSKFVNDINYETENVWMKTIPYDVRDEAVRDLLNNFLSNFAKKKLNPNHVFKFKCKKDKINSLCVLTKHWNKKRSKCYSK